MSDLSVAVAQSAGDSRNLGENMSAHARLASLAAEHGARLVVFPELSLTGYHRDLTLGDAVDASDKRLLPLQAVADAHDIVVVAGAPIASSRGLHIGSLSFAPKTGVTTYLKRFLGEGGEVAFVPGAGGSPLEAHVERLRRYAREHRMVVLMANYGSPVGEWSPAGRSAIWSSDGSLLGCAPPRGEALVIATKSSCGWDATVVTAQSPTSV